MSKRVKVIVVIIGVAGLVALSIAGIASAAGPVNPPVTTPYGGAGCGGVDILTVSQLLGLTPEQLQAELQTGKSLLEIATAKGVTEQQLVDAILIPHKTAMQAQVTAGTITQAQADLMLQQMETYVRNAIKQTNTGLSGTGSHCGNGIGTGTGMMGGAGMMGGGGMMGNWNGQGYRGGGMMGGNRGMMGRGTGFSY
ncbi:MAG: hypothetical protein Q8O43_03395 [Dehalococcoidia bacterium]|nr:hypothetical protein [Dehalococcoidia bacterium]